MTKLKTLIKQSFAASDSASSLLDKVKAGVKAEGIRSRDKFYGIVLEAASEHYGVPLKTGERGKNAGKQVLDKDAKNWQAARVAVFRCVASVFGTAKPKTSASRDPVESAIKWVEKKELTKPQIKRLIRELQELL